MIYTSNEDVIKAIKAAAVMESQTLTSLAGLLGMSQSNFSQILHKKQLSFSDVSRIAGAIGYQLEFQLIPGPELFQDGPNDQAAQPGPQTSKPGKQ